MESNELIQREISVDDLEGVPPVLRAPALAGQIASYLAGTMATLGTTLQDLQAVGAFLAKAGTFAVGCQLTFMDGDGTVFDLGDYDEPIIVDPDEVATVLVIVSNQQPKTQPYQFAMRMADLLPIRMEKFPAKVVNAESGDADFVHVVTRHKIWFQVAGREAFASNLGTGKRHVFTIADIPE